MSLISKIEEFIVPPWVHIVLEIFPYALALCLLLGLEATRGTLQHERDQHKVELAQLQSAKDAQEKAFQASQTAAIAEYSSKLQELQPVILNSIDTGKAYANTPSGRAGCLSAQRVQSILKSRNAEFASATRSGTTALRSSGSTRK